MAGTVGTLQQKAASLDSGMTTTTTISDEYILTKIMEQNLEGVMFHLFEIDLYNLLDLDGFKAMHKHHSREEMGNLGRIKDIYIKRYGKLPQLETKNTDYWKNSTNLKKDISHEEIVSIVKDSIKAYADWETEVLENLLKWKRNSEDRKTIHEMVEDVMKELKQIEAVMSVLEEYHYNYECIHELSDYLYKKF